MSEVLFNMHDVVLLATVAQCLIFVILILTLKPTRTISDYLLAGFLLMQAAIPLDILINFGAAFRGWAINTAPNIFFVFGLAYWLEGPLLLWFTRSRVDNNFYFKKTDALYIAPCILYFLFMMETYYLLEHDAKIAFLQGFKIIDQPLSTHTIVIFRELTRVLFSIACLWDIKRSRTLIRQHHSTIERIDFGWLNLLVYAFFIIHLWALGIALGILINSRTPLTISYGELGLINNYVMLVLITVMIFATITRSNLFEGVDLKAQKKVSEKTPIPNEYLERLELHMQEHKPYLANILTLEQLASQLEISPRQLSNIINRHYQRNFFEFINRYRIEEAKQQLADPNNANKTIIAVMNDSGFNSKATFNNFFKKVVGKTPSQYRKNIHANDK